MSESVETNHDRYVRRKGEILRECDEKLRALEDEYRRLTTGSAVEVPHGMASKFLRHYATSEQRFTVESALSAFRLQYPNHDWRQFWHRVGGAVQTMRKRGEIVTVVRGSKLRSAVYSRVTENEESG